MPVKYQTIKIGNVLTIPCFLSSIARFSSEARRFFPLSYRGSMPVKYQTIKIGNVLTIPYFLSSIARFSSEARRFLRGINVCITRPLNQLKKLNLSNSFSNIFPWRLYQHPLKSSIFETLNSYFFNLFQIFIFHFKHKVNRQDNTQYSKPNDRIHTSLREKGGYQLQYYRCSHRMNRNLAGFFVIKFSFCKKCYQLQK